VRLAEVLIVHFEDNALGQALTDVIKHAS